MVEVCSTSIYLANPDADYNDYVEGLKLTPEEFNIVKNLDPMSRQFLIKKAVLKGDGKSFSALATLDLSGLGGYLKILSASADNLEILKVFIMKEWSLMTGFLNISNGQSDR